MIRIPLAIAGTPAIGHIDEHGYVWLGDGSHVQWWVLGDDHWHVPAASASLRQYAVDNSPVVESSIRVPGGDVVWRAAAVFDGSDAVIAIECENRASIPVAVGVAHVDRKSFVTLAVHPVTHTHTWRGALNGTKNATLPELAAVSRGWLALAGRGAQITTNDPMIDEALVAARTSVLLHHGDLVAQGKKADRTIAAAVANALTLLDYEDEAGALRRAARLRPVRKGLPLVEVATTPAVTTDALTLLSDARIAAETVMAIRGLAVNDTAPVVDCLPGYEASWRGRSVDVTGLPTNEGTLAYAVRWHGERPALLWELEPAATLSASALDSNWTSDEAKGEVLLAQAGK